MLVELLRPEYDPAREHAWHLSIWMAPELHAWCVQDRATGEVMALQADLGEDMPAQDRTPLKPVTVSFTALPETSTLVPESALTAGNEMRHLKMVHGTLPTGLLRDEPIATLGARCIYLHDEEAEHILMARYPHARSLPLQGTMVHAAMARSAHGTALVLHRSALRVDLAIANEGRLLLSNNFYAATAEDVLYFALFALEQCGVGPKESTLHMGGTHLTAAEEELLARYFERALPLIAADDPMVAGSGLEHLHHWSGLIEQFACAS
ncbi:MAG: DUF3822 family protein [Flavobacteriales bacterium]